MTPPLHARIHRIAAAARASALRPRGRGPAPTPPGPAAAGRGRAAASGCAAVLAVLLLPAAVEAQVAWVHFNGGAQATSTSFRDSVKFTEYREDANFDAAYGVATGVVFDAGGGVRLPAGLGFGVGVSRFDEPLDPVSIDARIPHPFFFDRPRTVTGSQSGLARRETAVHAEIRWFAPLADTVELAVFGGPTFFQLRQDVVTAVQHTHQYPYDEAAFGSATSTPQSASAVGFNAGVDVGFFLSGTVGVGAMLRYSKASLDLPSGDADQVSVDAGGLHVGGGLRLRF